MAIEESTTPETGARGRRQDHRHFPDGFNSRAREELMRDATPVTTRPFLPSSSPLRRSASAIRHGRNQRQNAKKNPDPNTNYYEVLTNSEDEITRAFSAIDLEKEAEQIIAQQTERMKTRSNVLRAFTASISACAKKFDGGYASAVAHEFIGPLLHYCNRFLQTGEAIGSANVLLQPKPQTSKTAEAKPPPMNQNPRRKAASFADVTKTASSQAPGDVRIAPTRRQPVATSNHTDRRILLRLKDGSSFFEKNSYQIRLALNERLALNTQDIQDIKPTNTGWALLARNEEIQKKILDLQEEWGPSVDLDTAEKQVTWYTYLIKDFPSELRSYDDSVLDFEKIISEEIIAQTGQKPVQWRRSSRPSHDPTKTTLVISFDKPVHANFRLLGLGAYSFRLTKPKRLTQCQNCWLFHPPVRCTAKKTCRTCGISDNDHDTENCHATPKCANCYGPHHADSEQCYARPKKVGNVFQKLSKSQKMHARELGLNDYRRRNTEPILSTSSSPPAHNDEPMEITPAAEDDIEMSYTDANTTTASPQTELPPLARRECNEEDSDGVMEETVDEQPTSNVELTKEGEGKETEEAEEEVEERAVGEVEQVAEEQVEDPDETEEEVEDNSRDDGNHAAKEAEEEAQQDGGNSERSENNSGGDQTNARGQAQPSVTQPVAETQPSTTITRSAIRGRTTNIPATTIKKRFLTTYAARRIIPSDDTNLSSDGPTGDNIMVAPTLRHSPPSSPPLENRRRDESPPKRLRARASK